ncbi:MAG TPA: hypothetical protein VNT99_05125 [Methylomirabilota bacterium]|nr:hypothetical protein [Methylomirabilota bacterium]
MFAAFLGAWEVVLILLILGGMVTLPLAIFAVVWFVLRQQKRSQPPISTQQQTGH